MKQIRTALNNTVVAIRAAESMLRTCPRYRWLTRRDINVALGMLTATYDMLYALALEASHEEAKKIQTENKEHNS